MFEILLFLYFNNSYRMAQDIITQFYTCLNLPVQEKLIELARIIEQCSSNKDLQNIFPELINHIFSSLYSNGWGLRTVTSEVNRYEFESLMTFLEPRGPIFRLCYKLLSDPQLKYHLPISDLPLHLQITLERGRYPQFYADLLSTDPQTMNVATLALNPFDYYIFHFALELISNNQYQSSWENRNSVYFSLACDYLMHFLPSDPNVHIIPTITNYTGKMPMAAPLQTANRPLYSPSLLLRPGLTGSSISNQHTSQAQSRNEIWRSETVLQVFVDIWMGIEQFNVRNMEPYQRNKPIISSSPERVRIVRVLVKHLHSYSAKHVSDPAVRSSSLRKYAQQIMCAGAYHYIRHLVMTWPLDASFRLVMELWLSLIQPWRYIDNTTTQDRYVSNNNHEEGNTNNLDSSFIQFIAENFPSYTCIFQLVLPRFMRLDLTAYKNAIMLFRLGKVYCQQHLVPILCNLEQAIIDSGSVLPHNADTSFNNSTLEQSYTYNGVALHKWVAVAKQAITELNLSSNYEYEPIWCGNMKSSTTEFLKRIIHAKGIAEKQAGDLNKKLNAQNEGIWGSITHWFMMGDQYEDQILLQEYNKVPSYLNASINFFSNIFGLNENALFSPEPVIEDSLLEQSSIANSTSFPLSITNKLRSNTPVHYMGDSDLMPITSYESTILVRMLHQIASRTNELYGQQFSNLWNRRDFWGYLARELLQKPCTIQKYVKDITNHQSIMYEELPARVSLRRLGSHAFVFWVTVGYFLFKIFSLSGLCFLFVTCSLWLIYVFTKAGLKMINLI